MSEIRLSHYVRSYNFCLIDWSGDCPISPDFRTSNDHNSYNPKRSYEFSFFDVEPIDSFDTVKIQMYVHETEGRRPSIGRGRINGFIQNADGAALEFARLAKGRPVATDTQHFSLAV